MVLDWGEQYYREMDGGDVTVGATTKQTLVLKLFNFLPAADQDLFVELLEHVVKLRITDRLGAEAVCKLLATKASRSLEQKIGKDIFGEDWSIDEQVKENPQT